MKKNIRFLIIPVLFTFVLFSCDKQGTADEDALLKAKTTSYIDVASLSNDCSASVDLIAGKNYVAGKVNVTRCDGGVQVEFVTENSWIITEVHVDVETDPNLFPMTKTGNPKVGNFLYGDSFDISENVMNHKTTCIPIPEDAEHVYIAAHAVVCGGIVEFGEPDFDALCASIPGAAVLTYSPGQIFDGPTYNQLNLSESGDTEFDGDYFGWCIEPGVTINSNTKYDVNLLCSLGDLTAIANRIIVNNFDLVNFVLNQNYVGYNISAALGTITVEDVQMALWRLIKPADWVYGGKLVSDPARVSWILQQTAGKDGYLPECGGVIAVILVPTEAIPTGAYIMPAQLTLITIPVLCYGGCETAWGKGFDFPGNNWFMYFRYCVEN